MAVQSFEDGAVIFRQGDEAGPVYMVDKGMVRISKISHRSLTILGEVVEGGIFGEMALIDDSPRMATAIAVGPTVCSTTDVVQMQRKLALLGPQALSFYGEMIAYIRGVLPYADRPHDLKIRGETAADRAARQLLERLPELLDTLQHPPPAIITVFNLFAEYIENRLPPR